MCNSQPQSEETDYEIGDRHEISIWFVAFGLQSSGKYPRTVLECKNAFDARRASNLRRGINRITEVLVKTRARVPDVGETIEGRIRARTRAHVSVLGPRCLRADD